MLDLDLSLLQIWITQPSYKHCASHLRNATVQHIQFYIFSRLLFTFLKDFVYFFYWKTRFIEIKRGRESESFLIHQLTLQIAAMVGVELTQIERSGVSPRSPMWLQGPMMSHAPMLPYELGAGLEMEQTGHGLTPNRILVHISRKLAWRATVLTLL